MTFTLLQSQNAVSELARCGGAGGEAHSQEQPDSDLHRPAGAGQAQRACHWREGGTQAGLLPLLEHQTLLHQVLLPAAAPHLRLTKLDDHSGFVYSTAPQL